MYLLNFLKEPGANWHTFHFPGTPIATKMEQEKWMIRSPHTTSDTVEPTAGVVGERESKETFPFQRTLNG
jgi:hypothetical protein